MDYHYIQLDYLEEMAAGDLDTRRELLRMLIDELERSGPRLNVLWEGQNRAELLWLCHHLKSTFPFVGNARLASLNRELEVLLRQGKSFKRLESLLLEMGDLTSKVLKELRQELGKS